MSGLKVNFHKRILFGVNIPQHWLEEAARVLNCKLGFSTFDYLGLPIGAKANRKTMWQPVIDIMRSKLSRWKNRQLSIGGRVIILKSVLSALPVYFFSFFKAPSGIILKLESLFKQFLWGRSEEERKICWVKWEQVCKPVNEGGLGIKNLRAFNLALVCKWKVKNLGSGLWYRALVNRYGLRNGEISRSGGDSSEWWKDICQINMDNLSSLDEYSVKEAYRSLSSTGQTVPSHSLEKVWNKAIPSNVSCMVWRMLQNRIPTKDNLVRRGVLSQGQNGCTGGCGHEESVSHIFFECHLFAGTWKSICRWLGVHTALSNEG